MASLAQIVAALSVTYDDAGVVIWLRSPNHSLLRLSPIDALAMCNPESVADAVRRIGDADPDDFTITEKAH